MALQGPSKGSTDPLQVAVARLLGYRWPDQEPRRPRCVGRQGRHRPHSLHARRTARRRSVARGLANSLRIGMVWVVRVQASHRSRGQVGHVARRLAPQQLLRAALQAVPTSPLCLARLGRPQGRLCLPGQLPQARPHTARNPDLFLPPGLDQRAGRRGKGEQDRGRPAPKGRPGVAGEAETHPGRQETDPGTTSSFAGSRSPSSRSAGTPTSTTASG